MLAISCSIYISIGKVVVNFSFCLACYCSCVGKGRPPNVEIRRMQHDGSKETVQKGIFIETSSDEEDEMTVEDGMELTEDRTGQIQFISEFPLNIEENSWEDGLLLRLYVYGVRHPHLV